MPRDCDLNTKLSENSIPIYFYFIIRQKDDITAVRNLGHLFRKETYRIQRLELDLGYHILATVPIYT